MWSSIRGDVVTNAHVVGNATRFVVTLASGDSHPATAIGRDAANDLAVIRITGARPRPATFADSSQVDVGDIVLALGNPLGLRSSVTEGIVSALGRSVPEGNGVILSGWINNGNFMSLGDERDPNVGLQEDGATFTIPREPVRCRIHGIETFNVLRGGEYFFMPSLSALRWIGNVA